ncbi:MAG: hypothetical protein ACREDF_09775, partial [Thermoplasmata archaeon]
MDELNRVLRETFGRAKNPSVPGLGDYDSANVSTEGQIPGLAYQGGRQTQEFGPKGRRRQAVEEAWEGTLRGVDPAKCPPWLNEDCLDVFSRLLEQTFRNFQLAARRPSHIDPPFGASCIDEYAQATIIGGGYGPGTFQSVTCVQIPQARRRGEIVYAAHAVENPASWPNLEWRLTLNGTPIDHYDSILFELFPWPKEPICLPHLIS